MRRKEILLLFEVLSRYRTTSTSFIIFSTRKVFSFKLPNKNLKSFTEDYDNQLYVEEEETFLFRTIDVCVYVCAFDERERRRVFILDG